MDKNKCPKLKIQKNFPRKISYIDTTHGGTFFATFFKISINSLHYVASATCPNINYRLFYRMIPISISRFRIYMSCNNKSKFVHNIYI